MAKLMLIGPMATLEILTDPDDPDLTLARCEEHSTCDGRLAPPGNCDWRERYDTTDDAWQYAARHADEGGR